MEKLQFDTGLRSYRINGGGVLRFNPADPNLYARFLEAAESLRRVEKDLTDKAAALTPADADGGLKLLQQADGEMKDLLNWVFGGENDFRKLLQEVNLLAVGDNGQRVITNLLEALRPALLEGAKRCAGQQAQAALDKARARRESQC